MNNTVPSGSKTHLSFASKKFDDIRRELQNSRAQLRQVIDLIPEFIYARDYEGNFLLVNDLAAKLIDQSPAELEGKHYNTVNFNNHDQAKEKHLEEDRQVMDSNMAIEIPLEKFTFPDETVKYVRTVKVPFAAAGPNSKGVLGISFDITKFIQADHLKDEYIHQLEQLAFTTSHIVRQPLTSIIGLINLLEGDNLPQAELTGLLADFKEQVVRLDDFTKELSDKINTFRNKISMFPDSATAFASTDIERRAKA